MNSLIESLNMWGARFADFAPPILWQSSLLIAVIFAIDLALRRKIRPAVRYVLWFAVFIKLLAPPTLALPTSAAWWLRMQKPVIAVPHTRVMTVNYTEPVATFIPSRIPFVPAPPPPPQFSRDAWFLLGSVSVSALLAAWAVFRWRQVSRCVKKTTAADGETEGLFAEIRGRAGLRSAVRLRLTTEAMSPAVCGLFRPVVLLPQSLVEKLTPNQLRAVLLHELIHLRRRDVWVNCAQMVLQIIYWWNPLLWFANARIRRVREEAVDDAVMFALNEEAEIYAPTLLEVAKLAFNRPLATLGLVGILESRNALRHRIERLLNFSAPRRVGVSVMSVIGIAAFTALAVPMGEPPARPLQGGDNSEGDKLITFHAKVNPEIFVRNIQTHGSGMLHTTNDTVTDILASILDGFGVDCTPPRDIHFDAATGQVTLQNTPEALQIIDSVIRELNLAGGEHVLNPPYNLKKVVIDAKFYQMGAADVARLNLVSGAAHREGDLSPWWDLSGAQFLDVQNRAKAIGIEPMMSPRIQTSHGVTASMSIRDGTNNLQLYCVPYVHGGSVSLSVLARPTGEYAPKGAHWPDVGGHTNCAIFARATFADGDGVVLQAVPEGSDKELIILLKAKILEASASSSGGGSSRGSGSTNVLTPAQENMVKAALAQRLSGDVEQLRSDGKLLYQQGKYDEAEKKLNEVLANRPGDPTARYYLSLIKQAKVKAPSNGSDGITRNSIPAPNLYARTNRIFTSPERKKIYDKLTAIRFDKISFPNLSLSEVVRGLVEATKRRDVDQQGINFILNFAKPQTGANGQPQNFDPATGQPIAANTPTNTEEADLRAVTISLDPGLENVRLLDVLEAIVKSADHPLKYSILDYGIEFSFKGGEQLQLHTRTFKLDPNTFYMGLQNVSPMSFGSTNKSSSVSITPHVNASGVATNRGLRYVTGVAPTTDIQLAVINFFTAVGVNLAAPKSVFFNDRQGTLTVHATDDDLELIEQAINTLNTAPPEVTVKVRFVEVDMPVFKSPGIWTNVPSTGKITGILTEPQFHLILKWIEQRDNATLLSEGEVTTMSGRQANFQILDVKTMVNGLNATATNNSMHYNYEMTNMPFGTTLDVSPVVAADGYTIRMTVTPTVTEFLGYDNPKDYLKYDEKLKQAVLPLPKSRVRQMTTSVTVWDGQTVVLGNLSDETVVTGPGGAIRQPYNDKKKDAKKKELLIFITPTIIDPSGNRVHEAEHSKDYYDGPSF